MKVDNVEEWCKAYLRPIYQVMNCKPERNNMKTKKLNKLIKLNIRDIKKYISELSTKKSEIGELMINPNEKNLESMMDALNTALNKAVVIEVSGESLCRKSEALCIKWNKRKLKKLAKKLGATVVWDEQDEH